MTAKYKFRMLRGTLYTITNRNTSTQASINFEDFKQSNATNPRLASIDVVDSLNDPENGSGTINISAWANHTRPSIPTLTIQHTGRVGVGVSTPLASLHVAGNLRSDSGATITGSVSVNQITYSDTTVQITKPINVKCVQFLTPSLSVDNTFREVVSMLVQRGDQSMTRLLLSSSGNGTNPVFIRVTDLSNNIILAEASFAQNTPLISFPVTTVRTPGSTVRYSLSIQARASLGNNQTCQVGVRAVIY